MAILETVDDAVLEVVVVRDAEVVGRRGRRARGLDAGEVEGEEGPLWQGDVEVAQVDVEPIRPGAPARMDPKLG